MNNNTQFFEDIVKAAENGDADAQYRLGRMYYDGEGVQQDYAEALKWYHKAAERGNADAQYMIGDMYVDGEGVSRDYAEAAKWYHKAAKHGHAGAPVTLLLMYDGGHGVQQGIADAMCHRLSADKGDADAQFKLGRMYYDGKGVQQDYAEAVKWYSKVAEQGYSAAQYNLGLMYENGTGVSQDYAEALKWYHKAAEQGEAYAQLNIGAMYKNGKGVPKDNAEAAKWYRKAAEQGHVKAQIELDKMKEEVSELDMHMGSRDISLDELIGGDGKNSHMDFLVFEGENQEESLIKKEQSSLNKYYIAAALSGLDESEKYIILNRVMADNQKSLQEIGDKYSITKEEARWIEKQALKKMQQVLRDVVVTSSVVRQLETTEKLLAESSGKQEYICPIMGAKFVLIPAGTFMMGSPVDEIGRSDNETLHQVTISKPFYLQTTQVTQRQWEVVMGNNPSKFKGENLPVETVSWDDAQEYIQKLNELAGDVSYRLPTEAEWEYACRAGSNGKYCFGDDETMLGEYGWCWANSNRETHPVGLKRPNVWGLYDMHGSVWEWCSDWYGANYYNESPCDNPKGPGSGSERVVRGGSWGDFAQNSSAASRFGCNPDGGLDNFGFRIAVTSR